MNLPRNSTTYKITGTETFRLSSSKILSKWGSNLQNIEKNLRRIYVADDGYKFCQVDQAGAEALIVAYLAPKGQYRDLFLHKIKPHVFVALHVFADQWLEKFENPQTVKLALDSPVADLSSIPDWKKLDSFIKSSDNWKSSERFYYLGKKIVHASSYGLGPNTFVTAVLEESEATIVLSRRQAEQYLEYFHKLFPEIRKWHFMIQRQLNDNRVLRNLFDFPYAYTGFVGESMFKEAYAFVPQSTVGTITNIAYTKLQQYIEDNGKDWHLLANTHDSYLVEFPDNEDEQKEVVAKMKEFIEPELTGWDGTKFKMRSEAQVGYNWAPYKPSKNESGLVEV